jgi:hypothetical protein
MKDGEFTCRAKDIDPADMLREPPPRPAMPTEAPPAPALTAEARETARTAVQRALCTLPGLVVSPEQRGRIEEEVAAAYDAQARRVAQVEAERDEVVKILGVLGGTRAPRRGDPWHDPCVCGHLLAIHMTSPESRPCPRRCGCTVFRSAIDAALATPAPAPPAAEDDDDPQLLEAQRRKDEAFGPGRFGEPPAPPAGGADEVDSVAVQLYARSGGAWWWHLLAENVREAWRDEARARLADGSITRAAARPAGAGR